MDEDKAISDAVGVGRMTPNQARAKLGLAPVDPGEGSGRGVKSDKLPRGFAAINPERQRKIASKGGSSVPAHKRSFSQSNELAVSAGAKGGKAVHPHKRSFYTNPTLAAEAGRKGGLSKRGS